MNKIELIQNKYVLVDDKFIYYTTYLGYFLDVNEAKM